MKTSHLSHVLWLTLATLFISTSGPLGKYIAMSPTILVWWRSLFAAVFLFVFCKYKNYKFKIYSTSDKTSFLIASFLMGAHWISYFYALKLSSVAVGMISLFTFPVITALLEPYFHKSKFDPFHLVLGILVLVGLFIMAPETNFKSQYFQGILLGIISALCYALRTLVLKKHVKNYNGTILMFYQVAILTIILSPCLLVTDWEILQKQFPFILMLALLTTAIGHTLFIQSLNYFKVSTASIIGSAQPLFGIILAYFFLNEIPEVKTMLGGSLIMLTVLIESVRSRKIRS